MKKTVAQHFLRSLVRQANRTLIRSECRYCGTVLVGSVTQSLPEDEQRHVRECKKSRRNTSDAPTEEPDTDSAM